MDKAKTDAIIGEELAHIPAGSQAQNAFRSSFEDMRRASLRESPGEGPLYALIEAFREVEREHPDADHVYDYSWFEQREREMGGFDSDEERGM